MLERRRTKVSFGGPGCPAVAAAVRFAVPRRMKGERDQREREGFGGAVRFAESVASARTK
jgi:hypothetical protein